MFGNKDASLSKYFHYFVATGAYTGFSPYMPGTWASLVIAILLFFIPPLSSVAHTILTSILFVIGMITVNQVQKSFNVNDPSWIVIDEWWGMSIALIGVPHNLYAYCLAFIVFRIFDITKLFPINYLQRLPGSWGVMLDDGAAGLAALLIVQSVVRLLP